MTDLEFQEQARADSKLMEWRNRVDLPRVRKLIFEHRQEMSREGEWLRINSLMEQIWEIDDQLFAASVSYKQHKINLVSGAMIAERVKRLLKLKEKLSREYDCLLKKGLRAFQPKSNHETVTPEMIERAREYPIANLVDVKRGMARCIAHEDKTPSMDCRNNFAHCYACGFHADVIGVYRKLHGVGFREAVEALQ